MKLALLGFGKMGKTIEKLALEKGHTVVYKSTSSSLEGSLTEADVAIEFSNPDVAVSNLTKCFENNIPVVCGTTGWLAHYDEMIKLCKKRNGSFIYASNFSVGVNLFFKLNAQLAQLMEPWEAYDVDVEEIHHKEKKDAPSGTAITLAQGILPFRNKKTWKLDKATGEALKIVAIREDDVKGTHTVSYTSEIDTIKITHEVHSRDGFAKGAILAAEWLQQKKGVFNMKDVLGI
jgi:4-hydroxy-tetrahydrodipicolinate reductase